VEERIPDKMLLYKWIRNNQVVLRSGNEYFTALFKQYNRIPMNTFTNLTDDEIGSILRYVRQTDGKSVQPKTQIN